eukprot:g1215.t1
MKESKEVAKELRDSIGVNGVKRVRNIRDALASSDPAFVWENTMTQEVRRHVDSFKFYSHLSTAAHIFGDKGNLAILSRNLVEIPNIPSYVFTSPQSFSSWCKPPDDDEASKRPLTKDSKRDSDFSGPQWVVKLPLANSGTGIWVLGESNREEVAQKVVAASHVNSKLASNGKRANAVVIQRYVRNPLLWKGRKLQFRVYFMVKGDLSCWICRNALLQVCNKPFRSTCGESGDFDGERHITNVCKNKHNTELFVEESPCDLLKVYPRVYASMRSVLVGLVRSAKPFLAEQRSPDHFEYMGVDFLADADTRTAWLVECNCPPNNTGSRSVETFHHRKKNKKNERKKETVAFGYKRGKGGAKNMSKKNKTHDSAFLGSTTYGGVFGTHNSSSLLSGHSLIPHYQGPDADLALSLKRLSKKDTTTKCKALNRLCDLVAKREPKTLRDALDHWMYEVNSLWLDNDRRVREGIFRVMLSLIRRVPKAVRRKSRAFILPWLCSTCDSCREVSRAATRSLKLIAGDGSIKSVIRDFSEDITEDLIDYVRSPPMSKKVVASKEEAQLQRGRVLMTTFRALSKTIKAIGSSAIDRDSDNGDRENASKEKCGDDDEDEEEEEEEEASEAERFARALLRGGKKIWACLKGGPKTSGGVTGACHGAFQTSLAMWPKKWYDDADVKLLGDLVVGGFLAEKRRENHRPMRDSTLLFLQKFPKCWSLMNPERAIFPRLWAFLRNACYGSASYDAMIVLLANIPEKYVNDPGFVSQWFDSFDSALSAHTQFSRRSLSFINMVSAYAECLTVLSMRTVVAVPDIEVDTESALTKDSVVQNRLGGLIVMLIRADHIENAVCLEMLRGPVAKALAFHSRRRISVAKSTKHSGASVRLLEKIFLDAIVSSGTSLEAEQRIFFCRWTALLAAVRNKQVDNGRVADASPLRALASTAVSIAESYFCTRLFRSARPEQASQSTKKNGSSIDAIAEDRYVWQGLSFLAKAFGGSVLDTPERRDDDIFGTSLSPACLVCFFSAYTSGFSESVERDAGVRTTIDRLLAPLLVVYFHRLLSQQSADRTQSARHSFMLRLVRFYASHNATMLHEVPTLAQKYASVEEKLFTKLVKKYGTEDSLCEKETIPTWNSLLCALEACPRIALPEAVRSVCSGATCSGLTVANIQSERFFHLALALVDASVEDDADARGALQMIFREDFIPASFVKRLIAQCDEGLRVASRVTVCCDRDSASAASAMSWIRLSQILLSTLPSSSIPRRMLRSLFLLCHCDGGTVARSSWFEVAALARRSWISMRVSKLNEGSTDGETFVASDECTLLNVVSASDGINISREITSWLASVIMPKDPIDNGETTHLNFAVWAAQCLGSWALFSQHATVTAKSDDSWWEAVVVGSQSMWSRAKSNRVLWNRLIFAFGALVDCTGSIETIMKEIASSKDSITTSPFVWLPVEIAYAAACGYMHRRTSIARSITLYLNFASAPHFGAALQCAQDVQEIVSPNSSAVDVARRCLNVHLRPLLNSSAVITKPAAIKSACDALNSSWVGNVLLHTADSLCDALERKSDSSSLWAESEARKVALHIIVGCVVDVDVLIPAFDAPIIRPAADRLLTAPDDSKISPSVDSNQIMSKSTKTNESEVESQDAKSETLRKSSDAFVKGGKAIYTNEARGLVGVEIEIVRVHHDASGLSFYEILLPDGKIIGTIASKLQSKQVCAPSCRPDYRETLLQFYREHVPRKLDDVDMLLQKYHGNESTLIAAIETKYGRSVRLVMVDAASPTTPGTRSSGSDSEDEDANLKRALEMSVEPVSVVDKKEKSGV